MSNQQNHLKPVAESDQFDNAGTLPAINSQQEMQNLLFNADAMNQLHSLARVMSESRITVPKHFQGNPGDCMAICMQAAQWRMNPFAVAQKTHITQGGQLGYEAQLVNAVVTSIAPIEGRMDFNFIGDWGKILGRVKEMKSEKTGGKYYLANWNTADEQGLGVEVYATLKGESRPRVVTIMLSQCYPRFSTQWATDPQQQITYVGAKKWARRYCPDVILGVYTPDEMEGMGRERDVTPQTESAGRPALETFPEEKFNANFPTYEKTIKSGKKDATTVIATLSSKYELTEEQENRLLALEEAAKPEQGEQA